MKRFRLWPCLLTFMLSLAVLLTSCSYTISIGGTSGNGSASGSLEEYRQEVFRLVNIERQKAGVAPLTMDNEALNDAAQERADEMKANNLYSHVRPNGTSCFTVLAEHGISWTSTGENIFYGPLTPAEAVKGWMDSPGHRANILDPNYTEIGIGYASGDGSSRPYWVQLFIEPSDF